MNMFIYSKEWHEYMLQTYAMKDKILSKDQFFAVSLLRMNIMSNNTMAKGCMNPS